MAPGAGARPNARIVPARGLRIRPMPHAAPAHEDPSIAAPSPGRSSPAGTRLRLVASAAAPPPAPGRPGTGLARYVRPLSEGRCPPGLQPALQRLALEAARQGLGPVAGLAAALEDAVAVLLARPSTAVLQRQVAAGVQLAERMREALRDGAPLGALVIAAADHIATLEQAGLAVPRAVAGPEGDRWRVPWSRRGSAACR